MKDLRELEAYRLKGHYRYGGPGNPHGGVFTISSKSAGRNLVAIASVDEARGWDHVSVSLPSRCPNWLEMEQIKRMFFKDDEVAMQLHVPSSDHINIHPYCLHLWRPHREAIPMPPRELV